MFQKTVHDAAHGDVLAHALDAGPQAADAAHDQVDLHAGLRRAVKRLDDLAVHQRIHLGDDARGQAAAGRSRPRARSAASIRVVQLERRDQQLAHALELADAGQQVEEIGGVLAEVRAAGQQAEVGVKPRGGGIVIAGGEVDVAADVDRPRAAPPGTILA